MQIATEGQRGIKGHGRGIRCVWVGVCVCVCACVWVCVSWPVWWRSSRWQRHVSMAIQSQMIPLMCCHFCDLGARPALRWKRRKVCMRVYVCACACVVVGLVLTEGEGVVVLIYSLSGQLVPTWNHGVRDTLSFQNINPRPLGHTHTHTHTHTTTHGCKKSNVSPGATVCKNSILHTMLPCRHYCPVTVCS